MDTLIRLLHGRHLLPLTAFCDKGMLKIELHDELGHFKIASLLELASFIRQKLEPHDVLWTLTPECKLTETVDTRSRKSLAH